MSTHLYKFKFLLLCFPIVMTTFKPSLFQKSFEYNFNLIIPLTNIYSSTDFFNSNFDLKIEPNKKKKEIQIKFNLEKTSTIEVLLFDMNGRMVETFDEIILPQGYRIINISTLTDRTGFLQIKINEEIITQKVVY